jgi:hypothetical protein
LPLGGVDHRQQAGRCVTDMPPPGRYAVSNSADDLKHDLECLRLASDLMQLFRDTRNAELRAHCVRMAAYWADRANGSRTDGPPSPDNLDS